MPAIILHVLVVALFVLPAAAQDSTKLINSSRSLVKYLNDELAKSRYAPMALHKEECSRELCSYKLTETSFLEIAGTRDQINRIKLVANIEGKSSSDFSDDMKAATFLYSLILWGNLSASSTYDDANKLLSDLLNKSAKSGAAVISANDWTYGLAHVRCFGASTMFIALKTLTSVQEIGELPAACKK